MEHWENNYQTVPKSDHLNPVVMAKRTHPFPSRTRKLSSLASMVLHGRLCGRVERRRIILQKALIAKTYNRFNGQGFLRLWLFRFSKRFERILP